MLIERLVETADRLDPLAATQEDLRDFFDEWGLYFSDEDMVFFSEHWLKFVQEGDQGTFLRDSFTAEYAAYCETLKSLNNERSAEDVGREAAERHDFATGSAATIKRAFNQNTDIYYYDRGLWIHRENLPPGLEKMLTDAIPLLLELVESAGAINVTQLLESLPERLDELKSYPYLVRYALIRTGKVSGSSAGLDLSWGYALSLEDARCRLETFAAEQEQPFEYSSIWSELQDITGYTEATARLRVWEFDGLLRAGLGKGYSIQAMFQDRLEFESVRLEMWLGVSSHGLLAAPSLFDLCSAPNDRIEWTGDAYWAILRSHPKARSLICGRLLWSEEYGDNIWDVLPKTICKDMPLHSVSWLAAAIRDTCKHDEKDAEHVARILLRKGVDCGALTRISRRWYVSKALDLEVKVQLIRENRDVLDDMANSPQFVRDPAVRELWRRVQ